MSIRRSFPVLEDVASVVAMEQSTWRASQEDASVEGRHKERLGPNAIVGVSTATARAVARVEESGRAGESELSHSRPYRARR